MSNVGHVRRTRRTHRRQTRSTHGHSGYLPAIEGAQEVYEQAILDDDPLSPPGTIGGENPRPGLPSPDATPPDPPTGLTLTWEYAAQSDGTTTLRLVASLVHPSAADLFASFVEVTADHTDAPDPNDWVPIWTNPTTILIGKSTLSEGLNGVRGGTTYWARAYARDYFGNQSDYTTVEVVTTGADGDAPGIPQNFAVAGGFRGFGARWDPSSAPDLMFNQLRFCPDDGLGAPDGAWEYVHLRNNALFVDNLPVNTQYHAQVRAVDFSGNVQPRYSATGDEATNTLTAVGHSFVNGQQVVFDELSGGDGLLVETEYWVITVVGDTFQVESSQGAGPLNFTTDVTASKVRTYPSGIANYQSQSEAGWSDRLTVTTKEIGATDIAFGSLITDHISTAGLSADVIKAGELKVGTSEGSVADGIKITMANPVQGEADIVVGRWDETGLYIGSNAIGLPDDLSSVSYVRVTNAGLSVYLAGVLTSAITPDGINATAIKFGTMPGGHNLLLNSSFELADFVSVPTTKTWDVQADWTGSQQTNTNATNGTNSVTVTGVSY